MIGKNMHKNVVWFVFLLLIALIMIWFSGKAVYELYSYWALSSNTSVYPVEFSVKKQGDNYGVCLKYKYDIAGISHEREEILKQYVYKSPWMAETKIKKLQKQKKWIAWYNPQKIDTITLNRILPIKSSVYALIIVALLVYFLWLGCYAAKYK